MAAYSPLEGSVVFKGGISDEKTAQKDAFSNSTDADYIAALIK